MNKTIYIMPIILAMSLSIAKADWFSDLFKEMEEMRDKHTKLMQELFEGFDSEVIKVPLADNINVKLSEDSDTITVTIVSIKADTFDTSVTDKNMVITAKSPDDKQQDTKIELTIYDQNLSVSVRQQVLYQKEEKSDKDQESQEDEKTSHLYGSGSYHMHHGMTLSSPIKFDDDETKINYDSETNELTITIPKLVKSKKIPVTFTTRSN